MSFQAVPRNLTASEGGTLDIKSSPRKLARVAVPAVLVVAVPGLGLISGIIPLHGSAYEIRSLKVVGWLDLFIAAGVAWFYASQAFGHPVITISPTGFRHARLAKQPIPWTAIDAVSSCRVKQREFMRLSLSPAYLKDFTGSFFYRLNAALGGSRDLMVPTINLPISATELVAITQAQRTAALS